MSLNRTISRYSRSISNVDGHGMPMHTIDTPEGIRGGQGSLVRSAGKQFYDPADGSLVGAWLMDEGSGLFVRDYSIYGNHGFVDGAEWDFDGLNFVRANTDSINVGGDPSINITDGDMTIALWIKIDILAASNVVHNGTSGNDGYIFYLPATGLIGFMKQGDGASGAISSEALVVDIWYLVAGSKKGSTAKIWINGVERGVDISFADFGSKDSLLIGDGDDGAFDGTIHSCFIYSKEFTIEEHQNLYAAGMYRRTETMKIS